MATLPEASVQIDDQAGALAGGTDILTVFGCVELAPDVTPRMFASTKALLAKHGYSDTVDYCAIHFEETKKPVIVVGLPAVTAGAFGTPNITGNLGTSVVTVAAGAHGVRDAVSGVVTIVSGGIVGTDQIVFDLSLDGGLSQKRVRLGLALSYTVPYFGFVISFAAGTLLAGNVVLRFSTTAARWDQAGLAAARAALAAQQKQSRSWLVIGDLVTGADATNLLAEVNGYQAHDDRCVQVRAQVHDHAAAQLDSDWVAAIDATFGSVDSERRIDLAAGRGSKLSPITGWRLRRPIAWAASVREYQHDVQIPTWRKADGPCSGWSLEDEDGNTIEHDERTDGGLLLARFTCARTYANGPKGMFIALSLTRAAEGSLLSRTHNMAVANIACNVAQAETENAIGQVLELNTDGTGTQASLFVIEERVNSALAMALLQGKSEGKRASDAKWQASRSDVLNVPGAELTGVLDLRLNGTLERIKTSVRVQTAG